MSEPMTSAKVRGIARRWAHGHSTEDETRAALAELGVEGSIPVDDLICDLAGRLCSEGMRRLLDLLRRGDANV